MSVLFVGQAPNSEPVDPDQPPLSGRPAKRLGALMGLTADQFLAKFATANVLPAHPGKQGKGDAFPMTQAREAAALIDLGGHDLVVLLGKATARAFGITRPVYFQPVGRLVPFPHPSGVNRWWNLPANKRAAKLFLSLLLESSST